jgi:hypothetical protein
MFCGVRDTRGKVLSTSKNLMCKLTIRGHGVVIQPRIDEYWTPDHDRLFVAHLPRCDRKGPINVPHVPMPGPIARPILSNYDVHQSQFSRFVKTATDGRHWSKYTFNKGPGVWWCPRIAALRRGVSRVTVWQIRSSHITTKLQHRESPRRPRSSRT